MPTREELWTVLHQVVAEMVEINGIDPEDVGLDSALNSELGLTSVDAIHLMITLEERLGNEIDLESAIAVDGEYTSDMTMRDLHDQLCRVVEAS